MAQSIGTRTLQYPDKGDRTWYSTFVTFSQNITDYLDTVASATELSGDTSPQLGGDLDLNGNNEFNDDNGNEILAFSVTASAVNNVDIKNEAAGNAPELSAAGTDSNVGLTLSAKGTGVITTSGIAKLGTGADLVVDAAKVLDTNGNELLEFGQTASAVNHIKFTNEASGGDVIVSAVGDDTNIDLELDAKGSGKVSLPDGLQLSNDLIPTTDNTYDLGDSTNYFQTIYTDALTFDKETTTFAEESLCKVWVNYDQTTPSVTNSLNVSSVTDNSTGVFTINYSITMDGSENVFIGMAGTTEAASSIRDCRLEYAARPGTTTTIKMVTCDHNSSTSGAEVDAVENYVAIWGNYG